MPSGVYKHKKGGHHSEATKKKMSISKIGNTNKKGHTKKHGLYKNKNYVSWIKNKRNRLKRGAKGNHTFEEWNDLKKKYNYMCLCCKKFEPEIKLTEDHIIPLSLNGTDYIENIQPLCKSCNSIKNNKIIKY